jgi:hypothetical protein
VNNVSNGRNDIDDTPTREPHSRACEKNVGNGNGHNDIDDTRDLTHSRVKKAGNGRNDSDDITTQSPAIRNIAVIFPTHSINTRAYYNKVLIRQKHQHIKARKTPQSTQPCQDAATISMTFPRGGGQNPTQKNGIKPRSLKRTRNGNSNHRVRQPVLTTSRDMNTESSHSQVYSLLDLACAF